MDWLFIPESTRLVRNFLYEHVFTDSCQIGTLALSQFGRNPLPAFRLRLICALCAHPPLPLPFCTPVPTHLIR